LEINKLIEERNALVDEIKALAAKDDATADDEARADEALAAIAVLDKKIERAETVAKLEARVAQGSATIHTPQVMRKVESYDGADILRLRGSELRDRGLKLLEDKEAAGHLSARALDKVEGLVRSLGDAHGRHMLLTMAPEYRSAFGKYMANREHTMTQDEIRAVDEVRAASTTDAAGGFAIPELLDPSVILTNDGTVNPIRQVARIVTGAANIWNGISSAGVSASWDGEAGEVSDDAPTLANPTVTAHKAQAFIPFSVEIQGDWAGLATEAVRMFQDAKDRLEGTAFATGSGSSQPFGILTALDANTNVEVTPTTDGAFGAVDLFKVFNALPPRYRQQAAWMMSLDVMNEIRTFSSSSNGTYYTVDLTEGYGFRVLGRPAYENSGFADFTGTTGASNIAVVGDWSNYVVFDRIGSSVELVPHLFATGNNRPSGQRGWLFWWRVGADSVNDLGFRLLQNQ
jgi:HK97 family phage major capsid protein